MISVVIWLLVLWVCAAAGAAVLRRLRASTSGLAEELPFAAAIGLGVLAYGVLGAGLLGQVRVWVPLVLLVLLAFAGRRHLVRLARRLPAAMGSLGAGRPDVYALSLFLFLLLILTLLGALAPSRDNDYDSLVYHLTIPKLYIAEGRVHSIPWLTHSNFPFTLEMLYTVGLLLRDQSLAKLFHFGFGWLTVCAVFAFARRWWGRSAGWLGAAIFAAVPLVTWQMTTAYIELGVALYSFLAVSALARWWEDRSEGRGHGWLWVAALMCGWALGVKMLAGAVLIFAVLVLLWALRTADSRRWAARQALIFLLIAAAIGAPWYVKSYLWTGNPVYPFFYERFDGRYWTEERAQAYTEAQKAFGLGVDPLRFIALPWNLTMRPRWFFDEPHLLKPFNVYVWVFGPLLLAFVPALLLAGPVGMPGRLALWFALVFAALWFGLTQNGRYLIAILPALSACAGVAAARLTARPGLTATSARLVLALGLIPTLWPTALLAAPAARVSLGLESQSDYLRRSSGSPTTFGIFESVETDTPADARILILGAEPRTFYLDRDYLLGNHAEIFTAEDLADASSLLAALRRMGVTHLLIHASTVGDIEARSGRLETLLDDLSTSGRTSSMGRYEPFELWELAADESARA